MSGGRVVGGREFPGVLPAVPVGAGADLWEDVRQAERRLLFLDYDGTLAPLRERRNEAVPFPGTLDRLRALLEEGTTTVAIVSGRPLAELLPLVGRDLRVHIVGEHGWEERTPEGVLVRHPPGPLVEARIAEALARAGKSGFADRVERKRTGLVLHVRGMHGPAAAELLSTAADQWSPLADGVHLRLDTPSGGLELRAAARDKGTVVREWIDRAPGRTWAVYVGDDQTDEDAFRAIDGAGLGILVGPPGTPTAARAWLAGPGSIPEFLERWIAATHGRAFPGEGA